MVLHKVYGHGPHTLPLERLTSLFTWNDAHHFFNRVEGDGRPIDLANQLMQSPPTQTQHGARAKPHMIYQNGTKPGATIVAMGIDDINERILVNERKRAGSFAPGHVMYVG